MAGRIETKDIISPDVKKELNEITKMLGDLVKQISATTKAGIEMKNEFDKGAKTQKELSDNINKVNEAEKKLSTTEQEIIKIEKQAIDLQEKIKAQNTEQYKNLEKLRQKRAEQNKQLKEEIKLEGAQKDSIERLTVANKKLIKERDKLSTSTKAGRQRIQEINNQLNKNTELIKKNSSAQEKQRMNIGNYKSALEGMPGALGRTSSAVGRLSQTFKALLLNPIVAVIAAITVAVYALGKAIKSTDTGATEIQANLEAMKSTVNVLRIRLINLTIAFSNIFDKSKTWKERLAAITDSFSGFGDQVKESQQGAKAYVRGLDELEDAETNYLSAKATNEKKIAELEYKAQDRQVSTKERRDALKQAIKLGEEQLQKEKEFANRRLELYLDFYASKYQIDKEKIRQFIAADDEQAKAIMENDKEVAMFRNLINDEKAKELEELYTKSINLEERYFTEQKRNISRLSGFEQELINLEKQRIALKQRLISEAEKEFNIYKDVFETGINEMILMNNVLSAELQDTFKEQSDKYIASLNRELEATKEIEQEKKDIKQELGNETFNIVAGLNDRALQGIEEQKERELQIAGDNAGEREKIEKKYDEERRKIQRRQAIIDKGQSIFNTILNTKEAFTKALTKDPTGILSTFNAILGAAQLAAIIATPIPKFKKGTNYSPEGIAIVGEEGRELIEYPGGFKALTPDTQTMTYLPKGAKVHTAEKTKDIIKDLNAEKLDILIMETKKIANKKNIHNNTILTDSGLKRIVHDANSFTKYIDTYFRK